MRLICTYEPLCAREGPFASVRSRIMLLWQRAAEARAGMDRDESTVMGCDIEIYQTVNADSDGPGSDRGRAARMVAQGCTIFPITPIHFQHRQAGSQRSSTQRAVRGMRSSRMTQQTHRLQFLQPA